MTRQSDLAEHIYFEEPLPRLVSLVKEAHGFINAQVIDEDLHLRQPPDGFLVGRSGPFVRGQSLELWVGNPLANVSQSSINACSRAPIDDYGRAFSSQRFCNFLSYAATGCRNEGKLVLEF